MKLTSSQFGREKKWITISEFSVILIFSLFPLFFQLPYRVNIFLSWEGAYRLYLGQIPYADFGLPLGFGFWIIPAIFFKIFGPFLFTLVKAQVFINIISLIVFRNILKLLEVDDAKRFLAIVLFIISYSFPNFWPWYNHSVYVFQLITLNLLLYGMFVKTRLTIFWIILAGFFAFLSFFTKQDSGGITIVFGGIILLYDSFIHKRYNLLVTYCITVLLVSLIFILPFIQHDFLYWFNYGQSPHDSRIGLYDLFDKAFGESQWEKFYLLMIILVVLNNYKKKNLWREERSLIFLFITVGMIFQALIIKATSPLPTDHYSYFHAFAFVFLISNISFNFSFHNVKVIIIMTVLLFFWWSPLFWNYAGKIFRNTPLVENGIEREELQLQSNWTASNLKAFENILMPPATISGIHNILALDCVEKGKDLQVLNMSELTPLAYEIGYIPPTQQPLWYHLNIGMFQKEVEYFNDKISKNYYDIVLFQPIPNLDNFYPYEVQEKLKSNYQLYDTFEAPRKSVDGYSYIEVYLKKDNSCTKKEISDKQVQNSNR